MTARAARWARPKIYLHQSIRGYTKEKNRRQFKRKDPKKRINQFAAAHIGAWRPNGIGDQWRRTTHAEKEWPDRGADSPLHCDFVAPGTLIATFWGQRSYSIEFADRPSRRTCGFLGTRPSVHSAWWRTANQAVVRSQPRILDPRIAAELKRRATFR